MFDSNSASFPRKFDDYFSSNPFSICTHTADMNSKLKHYEKSKFTERKGNNGFNLTPGSTRLENDADKSIVLPNIDIDNRKLLLDKRQIIHGQSMSDFISKKREIFLVEYSLSVKREDLLTLENAALDKENDLILSERLLEEDAMNFDEFLRNTNVLTQKTMSTADICIKEKLDKFHATKKLNSEILLLRTEISRNEDVIFQLNLYKEFLATLSPDLTVSISNEPRVNDVSFDSISVKFQSSGGDLKYTHQPVWQNVFQNSYRASPKDLTEILSSLEENNLSLILNSQEIEEALEDLMHSRRYNEDRLLLQVASLNQQISLIEANIFHENFIAQNLEYKAKMFSYGEFKEEDQDILAKIDRKVQKVYINCIGHNEANIGTLQMLSSIENRVEELFDILESLPGEKVKNAEITRGKERRLLIRERKIEEERFHQDERMKRSIARANANPRINTGRKLRFRSLPPKDKRTEPHLKQKRVNKDEDDQFYFFS